MGKAYSSDLRDRVQRHIEAGHTRRDAAIRFGVSTSSAIKLDQRVRATGSTAPARQGRPTGSGALARFRDYLVGLVEARPD
ncbi:MAG: IS630 family transposase, partial [Paracoccus sp. (in: a-proteobacteria)]